MPFYSTVADHLHTDVLQNDMQGEYQIQRLHARPPSTLQLEYRFWPVIASRKRKKTVESTYNRDGLLIWTRGEGRRRLSFGELLSCIDQTRQA
jgi:hypothetical protein